MVAIPSVQPRFTAVRTAIASCLPILSELSPSLNGRRGFLPVQRRLLHEVARVVSGAGVVRGSEAAGDAVALVLSRFFAGLPTFMHVPT